ncbi:hypothetical protein AHMF7605_07765 [Adhaeribacter arboris]|uniref:histidine kinase n=1 Tax=Adhaeribacter arboris TaxID=2072846 RepID=A0A2T2YD31_9BACT|nr:histidine kinase [Adhaeribacter arboris]PSR53430.1 hypothetical protein AHMF7605_07765 [Adhaeribacter arboris]
MAAPAKKTSAYWLPVNPVWPSHALTASRVNGHPEPGRGTDSNNSSASLNLFVSTIYKAPLKFNSDRTWVQKPKSLFQHFGKLPVGLPVNQQGTKSEYPVNCHFTTGKTTGFKKERQENTFSQELIQAQEQERQSLANELHDTLGQSVILMKNHILKLKNNLPESAETSEQINTLAEMVTDTLQKIREISYGLRPYELNLFGLTQALRSLTEEVADAAAWRLTLDLPKIDNVFLKEHEIYVYRVIQQCLEIVEKNAAAWEVHLTVHSKPEAVACTIQVTGSASFCLFLKKNSTTDFNLLRLQEQLKIIKGTITFTAAAPQVTTIHLTIPIQPMPDTHETA